MLNIINGKAYKNWDNADFKSILNEDKDIGEPFTVREKMARVYPSGDARGHLSLNFDPEPFWR